MSLTRSSGDGCQQLLNHKWQRGGGGGGSSQQVDQIAYVISSSLNWFGAWQAPVSCWLQASAVVGVIYSSPAFPVDPYHHVCSPHSPAWAL